MFNIFKKNKTVSKKFNKEASSWQIELDSSVHPESEFYYSMVESFEQGFVEKKIASTTMPDFSVKRYFQEGLYLTYANFNKEISTAYLKVALQIANKILELPQSETQRWNDEDLFTDLFKPNISIDKLYLDALLTNENIDTDRLSQLNVELLEYLKTCKGRLWEDVTQSRYLSSVWNLMIAGRFEQAKNYLNVKKKFPYVQNLYEWTREINNLLIAKHIGEENTHQLNKEFDTVFNIIRQAYWKTNKQKEENKYPMTLNSDYIRFQLAILRWLYVELQPLEDNWNQALRQVSVNRPDYIGE